MNANKTHGISLLWYSLSQRRKYLRTKHRSVMRQQRGESEHDITKWRIICTVTKKKCLPLFIRSWFHWLSSSSAAYIARRQIVIASHNVSSLTKHTRSRCVSSCPPDINVRACERNELQFLHGITKRKLRIVVVRWSLKFTTPYFSQSVVS